MTLTLEGVAHPAVRPVAAAKDFASDDITEMYIVSGSGDWSVAAGYLKDASNNDLGIIISSTGSGWPDWHADARILVDSSSGGAGSEDAGVVLRFIDSNNFYLARVWDGKFVITRRSGGSFATLKTESSINIAEDTDYDIRFSIRGTSLNAQLLATNGTILSSLSIADSTHTRGSCGFRCFETAMWIKTFSFTQLV